MQDRHNSSAQAMELRLSCTNISIWQQSFVFSFYPVSTSNNWITQRNLHCTYWLFESWWYHRNEVWTTWVLSLGWPAQDKMRNVRHHHTSDQQTTANTIQWLHYRFTLLLMIRCCFKQVASSWLDTILLVFTWGYMKNKSDLCSRYNASLGK